MSKLNRYQFAKKIYSNYLVLILDDKNKKMKYYTYEMDSNILEYIDFKNNINVIKKKKINFIIIDNMNIITINSYDNNHYKYYVDLLLVTRIIHNIKNNLIGSI